jgi:plastocyanin
LSAGLFQRPASGRIAQFEAPPPPPTEVTFGFTGLLKGGVPVEKTNAVQIIDYNFTPPRITIEAGNTVTFTNSGSQPHNAAGADMGGWDTGILMGGDTATVTFNRPGTYFYTCTPHPFMIGQIIVTGEAIISAPATMVHSPRPESSGTADPSLHRGAHSPN